VWGRVTEGKDWWKSGGYVLTSSDSALSIQYHMYGKTSVKSWAAYSLDVPVIMLGQSMDGFACEREVNAECVWHVGRCVGELWHIKSSISSSNVLNSGRKQRLYKHNRLAYRLGTGRTVRGSNPNVGEIFRVHQARPPVQWKPGLSQRKSAWGLVLTTHPF